MSALGIRLKTRFQHKFYKVVTIVRSTGREVWFTPTFPEWIDYSVAKVCAELGLVRGRERSDRTVLAMAWHDTTYTSPVRAAGVRVVNADCTDISKGKVQRAFEDAFGYPLAIDPLTFVGRGLSKSELNGTQDGIELQCPITEMQDGRVYQRLIDNRVNDTTIEDIRIPVVGRTLPLAYRKHRPLARRFENYNTHVRVEAIEAVTSELERSAILRFAKAIGLEFGEIDTLRDRQSSRLYVVDVNKSHFGPPKSLALWRQTLATRTIARTFVREFLNPLG